MNPPTYFRKPLNEVSEGHLKDKVKEVCRKWGAFYGMPVAGAFGRAGLPDFVLSYKGHFIGVETKTMKGKATALQEHTLKEIRDSGAVALIIRPDNLHELEMVFKYIDNERVVL
jgi:hypothetical protein